MICVEEYNSFSGPCIQAANAVEHGEKPAGEEDKSKGIQQS